MTKPPYLYGREDDAEHWQMMRAALRAAVQGDMEPARLLVALEAIEGRFNHEVGLHSRRIRVVPHEWTIVSLLDRHTPCIITRVRIAPAESLSVCLQRGLKHVLGGEGVAPAAPDAPMPVSMLAASMPFFDVPARQNFDVKIYNESADTISAHITVLGIRGGGADFT